MNECEKTLWQKIGKFEFDEPGVAFSFIDRLARENRWHKEFTIRVIEEYRKFIFLCCVSDRQITPSEEVDQAWHLHLVYTKSYWKDLCANVLNRELHHNPTKGGINERRKFDACYEWTLKLYEKHFAVKAPEDIWPPHAQRFAPAEFVRLDHKLYWLIRKPKLQTRIAATVLVICGAGILSMAAYTLKSFAGLFAVLLALAFIAWIASTGGGKGGGGSCSSGCSVTGCGNSHGHSGCSSHGCSGCGSGCGGGGCGGGGCGS